MALKKSELYSSIWEGCDQLRGGMDASQYKDYVLVLLFMKYVSDKKLSGVTLEKGTTFYDMLQYRGQDNIGDQINKIIGEFARNNGLSGIIDQADFNDETKLGRGKEKIDRLTNLLNIFNKPELNFSNNGADGDDLLGDAYEYLMKHFAQESGKSKGQFYTPAEVSRVMANLIEIQKSTSQTQTLYDPTCGSGSLLLKAAALAPRGITIYGQEMDISTRALAVMNLWLHGHPTADIKQGNTLANPQFKEENKLQTFDYAVANPPFSYKAWKNGLENPEADPFGRFAGYPLPPDKNGDYAFLLHFIQSLKSTGKGCIVMPLGVLFRGNTEGEIRKQLIQKGYIKAIIGLPPNLFYGTSIAACLIVLDKENAQERKHIFMIDASRDYTKDGNKNRLRERDIHKIVDVYKNELEIEGYSRKVSIKEIADPKNNYNLNIPRYIQSNEDEDIHDIQAHLLGGIPKRDIDKLENYWKVFSSLKNKLFSNQNNYYQLKVPVEELKKTINEHAQFKEFQDNMKKIFDEWKNKTIKRFKNLEKNNFHPKEEIKNISESLLWHYEEQLKKFNANELIDKYAIYQHLMDFWEETMQDDFFEILIEGLEIGKIVEKKKEQLMGKLIPPEIIVQEYFNNEQKEIETLETELENIKTQIQELQEEHANEEGLLAGALDDKGKITKASLNKAISEIKKATSPQEKNELNLLKQYQNLMEQETQIQTKLKTKKQELNQKIETQYTKLSTKEIQTIIIEKKWMSELQNRIQKEIEKITHQLTQRIKELTQRYETPLIQIQKEVQEYQNKVEQHLKTMGYVWK